MKKLMILTAILASGVMAFGEGLSNKFVASEKTADTWAEGWSGATDKVTFDSDEGVIRLETAGSALIREIDPKSETRFVVESNVYFDVSLDMLGQALDIDSLPTATQLDGAKLALFLLDTVTAEGLPSEVTGKTNLWAIARNPSGGGKLLVRLSADSDDLKGATRLTVKAYKNVLKSGTENAGFMVFMNGNIGTEGAIDPLFITDAYSITDDGVTWSTDVYNENNYLADALVSSLTKKRKSVLLGLVNGTSGAELKALDFYGNAAISKVEMNESGFDFIGADEVVTTITAGENMTVSVVSEATGETVYDSTTGAVTGNCTITVTLADGYDVLKWTPASAAYLTQESATGKEKEYVFKYTYAEGNNVEFRAAAASVTLNGTAYETLAEALNADVLDENKLTLNRDLNDADIGDEGYLPLTGNWTLDLAGKNIVAAGDFADSDDGLGVIYLAEGSLVITNSTETLGSVEATAANGVAVSCELENATLSIFNGIFKGAIHDKALDSSEEEAADEEAAEGETAEVTSNVTIYGGRFTVEPNAVWIPEGYAATQQTIDDVAYWVVAEATSETFTVTFVNEKGATEAEQTIEKSVESGKTVAAPDAPTADGFVFLGWFAEGADTAFDFATEITANITLTAKWGDWATFLGEANKDGVYEIDNEAELIALQTYARDLGTANVSFALTTDIALTKPWIGIGLDKAGDAGADYAFCGTFDGRGKTVSNVVFANLSMNGTGEGNNYRGFFGFVQNGTVKNLTVEGTGFGTSVPSGEYGCAMVVGELGANGLLEGCTSKGAIASGTHNVAGVCIRLSGGTISSCTNEAAVTGNYTKIAGIVAISQGGGTIKGCVNKGNLSFGGDAGKAGKDGVGGIIGYIGKAVSVIDCSNTGTITAGESAVASPVVGQIVGYNNGSGMSDGTNTGRADTLAVGNNNCIDGLTFATVADDTATFVKAADIKAGGTYKVMASDAAYAMAALGSVTFDTSLATVTVTKGTDFSDDKYTLTETKDTENEKVITYTLADTSTPAYTPVDPETPTACDSEDAANAMAAAINASKATLINAPADLTDDQKTAYRDLFTATVSSATSEGTTTYSVTVALTDAATTDIQAQVDGDVKTLEVATVAAADGDTKQELTTTPGIYYSVVAGATLDGMEVRSSTMATGNTLEVTLPKYEGAGFYRIKATVKAQEVVAE